MHVTLFKMKIRLNYKVVSFNNVGDIFFVYWNTYFYMHYVLYNICNILNLYNTKFCIADVNPSYMSVKKNIEKHQMHM